MLILAPPPGASITWEQQAYWDNEHTTLGMVLYAMMTSKDAIVAPVKRTQQVIQSASRHGNGFLVLQILLRRHHPRVSQSVAPTYAAALLLCPVMGGDGEFHVDYFHRYSRWDEQLQLYHEYGVAHKPSEYVIWFIEGLAKSYRFHMQNFEHSLRHFRTFNMHLSPEPPLPVDLTVEELSHQLTVLVPEHNSFSGRKRESISGTSVASIVTGMDYPGDYEDRGALEDHDINILALQRRRAYGSTQPSVPCQLPPCQGRSHPPDLCCICNQPHTVDRCWHVQGLPDNKSTRVKEFQALVASGDLPKSSSSSSRSTSSFKSSTKPGGRPRVSLIHSEDTPPLDRTATDAVADKPPSTKAPLDNDVRDVQELMLLQEQPFHVPSLQPSLLSITYPVFTAAVNVGSVSSGSSSPASTSDSSGSSSSGGPMGPPDDFEPVCGYTDPSASGLEPTIAPPPGHLWWHVGTGANSFVSSYGEDSYQLVPVKSSAGTATTGVTYDVTGQGNVYLSATDANGEEFVAHGEDMAIVPSFGRRSLSLHALNELGFTPIHKVCDCVELIDRSPQGKTYVLPVRTHCNTDFVAIRVNDPAVIPAAVPPSVTVAAINLASSLKGNALFYLIHLRLGCPGPRLMKELAANGRLKGLPAHLDIPDNFHCPICARTLGQKVASNPAISPAVVMKGAHFHIDFHFPAKGSIRGFHSVLVIVEAVSAYVWAFPRRSKHPPINILVWFIAHVRQRLNVSFHAARVDGG